MCAFCDTRWLPGARVGIIGGMGEMGKLFQRFFEKRGYKVEIADLYTEKTARDIIEEVEVVLFSVPLHRTVAIIEEHRSYLRPHQLVMDLSSLKVKPVEAMLQSRASVVGLHPMFGGSISSFAGQTLIACPVRIEPSDWAPLRRQFEEEGMIVRECAPEKHDELMAIIQVLFHLSTMIQGRVIRDLGVDIEETLSYTSPVYRMEISILGRMFAQSGWLYGAISQMNPHTPRIISTMQHTLREYERWFAQGDLASFVRDFTTSSNHLGEFCRKAYEESSRLLEVSTHLFSESSPP